MDKDHDYDMFLVHPCTVQRKTILTAFLNVNPLPLCGPSPPPWRGGWSYQQEWNHGCKMSHAEGLLIGTGGQ